VGGEKDTKFQSN